MLRLLFISVFIINTAYAQQPDTSNFYINAAHNSVTIPGNHSAKLHLRKIFSLFKNVDPDYCIDAYEDSVSTLSMKQNGKWVILDTLSDHTIFEKDESGILNMPVQREDFNSDGYPDLEILVFTNVNGNRWVKLFLYDRQKKQLTLLRNKAEGNDDTWDAPEYKPTDNTIHCERVSGIWGLSFKSTYKLKGIQAFPLYKDEYDHAAMDVSGKGAVRNQYRGYHLKWKLVKTNVYRE